MPAGFWVLSNHSKLSSLGVKWYRNLQMVPWHTTFTISWFFVQPELHLTGLAPGRCWRKSCHWLICILTSWKGLNVLKMQSSCRRIDLLHEKEIVKRTEIKLFGFPTNLNFYQLDPPKKPPSSNLQLILWWVSCGCPDCRSWGVPTSAIKQILGEIILLKSWLCLIMSFPQ